MNKLSKKIMLGATTVIVLLLVSYAVFYNPKPLKTEAEQTITTVSVSPLSEQIIPITAATYGQISSPVSMIVKAQSDGLITSIDFTAGEVVKAGQLLFTLKTSDSATQLKKLAAQAELSKQIYVRTKRLAERSQSSVSTVDLLRAKLNYQQDLAQYQQAEAIYNVKSPIDGVVTDTNVAVGDYVNAGDTLVKVIDQRSLEIRYQLPSHYAKLAQVGQSVIFTTTDNNKQYAAHVSYVAPIINDDMVGISLRAKIDNADGLLINRFGQVTQVLDNNYHTLAVPQSLVQSDSQGFYVYLFKDNKVFKQYFTAGELTKTGLIQIVAGLKAGDPLITTDPMELQEGQTVKANK